MSPWEHYQEAERLLRETDAGTYGAEFGLAKAHAHAVLATCPVWTNPAAVNPPDPTVEHVHTCPYGAAGRVAGHVWRCYDPACMMSDRKACPDHG